MKHILRMDDSELQLIKSAVQAVANHLAYEIRECKDGEKRLKKLRSQSVKYNRLLNQF